jgi:hypothetical protein
VSGTAELTTSSLPVGEHVVTASYAGDVNFTGTSLAPGISLLINTVPEPGSDSLERFAGRGVKVKQSTLLANDNDDDGHALTFQNLATTSANGGMIVQGGDWIFYTPPGSDPAGDTFTYEITDPLGGTAQVLVTINRIEFVGATENLTTTNQGDGSFRLEGYGIPGGQYRFEFTDPVIAPAWQLLDTATSDTLGRASLIDAPPGGAPPRTYRMIQQ